MGEDGAMTASVSDRYRRVAAAFTAVAEQLPHEEWDAPAPCEGWTGRDIVGHLVEWVPGFLTAAGGPALPEGPEVAQDPVGAWRSMSDAVQALLDDPAACEQPIEHPRAGRHRLDDAIAMFLLGDVLIHTWDLARTGGIDVALDATEVSSLLAGFQAMGDMLHASGQFGAAVAIPDDADPQTRLIAFSGRQP